MGMDALDEFDRAVSEKSLTAPRFWNKSEDFHQIKKWFSDRGDRISIDRLPEIGIVIDQTCAVFLFREGNSPVMFAHPFISNSKARKKDVINGLSKIIDFGIKQLPVIGVDTVVMFSKYRSILRTAKKQGFEKSDMVQEMVIRL